MEAIDVRQGQMGEVKKTVLTFKMCQTIEPALESSDSELWVCRYDDLRNDWSLSIATYGRPKSQALSLGGFRIAPADRVESPGYSNDREAINLARGMEKKVNWSRLARVAGPLAYENLKIIAGGKCVLLPTADARVGQPRDFELLEFAVNCLNEFRKEFGVRVNTGQDLGHGLLSDGKTHSLEFLHDNFEGSVLADTSKPTGEGNYFALRGVLKALDIPVNQARIGIVGCGNIGSHVLGKLRQDAAHLEVLEARAETRDQLSAQGLNVFSPDQKATFFQRDFCALVVNANGGTLDPETVETVCQNSVIRAITGCENLVMPDPSGVEKLRAAQKIFCPTEYCGMMGYLTAAEEYLSFLAQKPFDVSVMLEAAKGIEQNAALAARTVLESNFAMTFADAVRTNAANSE